MPFRWVFVPVVALLTVGCTVDFYSEIACDDDGHCPTGYGCSLEGTCALEGSWCPEDVMVDLGSFAMGAFEASLPESSDSSSGAEREHSPACSRPGVLPWTENNPTLPWKERVETACAKTGKRLCSEQDYLAACPGSFPYGDEYIAGACNDGESGYDGAAPTGAFEECVDATGDVFDLVGNVRELTQEGSDFGGGWSDGSWYNAECAVSTGGIGQQGTYGFRCCQ